MFQLYFKMEHQSPEQWHPSVVFETREEAQAAIDDFKVLLGDLKLFKLGDFQFEIRETRQ